MSQNHDVIMRFDVTLLFLSFVVAYFGSYMAISLSEQLRSSCMREKKRLTWRNFMWVILIGIALGGVGIWGMHFIGMAAGDLIDAETRESLDVNFNTAVTILSLIIAVITICAGVYVASQDRMFAKSKHEILEMFISDVQAMNMKQVKRLKDWMIIRIMATKSLGYLVAGGILAGGGVCMMHYIGMEAMEFDGHLTWNIGIVAASCLIAVVAATAAFLILFRLLSIFPGKESLRQAAAIVMTVAVCGMHYTGMAAAMVSFDGVTRKKLITSGVLHREHVATPIYFTVSVVLWIMMVVIFVDLRQLNQTYQKYLKRHNQLDMVNRSGLASSSFGSQPNHGHVSSIVSISGNFNNNHLVGTTYSKASSLEDEPAPLPTVPKPSIRSTIPCNTSQYAAPLEPNSSDHHGSHKNSNNNSNKNNYLFDNIENDIVDESGSISRATRSSNGNLINQLPSDSHSTTYRASLGEALPPPESVHPLDTLYTQEDQLHRHKLLPHLHHPTNSVVPVNQDLPV